MGMTIPRKPFNITEAIGMRDSGKSLRYIAEHFGVSVETARKKLMEAGESTSHPNFRWMEAKKAKNPVSGNLKPMEVLAVLAYHAYELTAPEVAAWLNMPRSTTQEYIRKGTEKLRTRGLPDA